MNNIRRYIKTYIQINNKIDKQETDCVRPAKLEARQRLET